MIERKTYLSQLLKTKDQPILKIITGIRGCGKSTLFISYIETLRALGVSEEQILWVKMEDLSNEPLEHYRKLQSYIESHLCPDATTYVFVDEIQNCRNFERALKKLKTNPSIDLYLSSSNAHVFTAEAFTLPRQNCLFIHMLPFSFRECRQMAVTLGVQPPEAFERYVRYGGFPFLVSLQDESFFTYLEAIYNTIIVKDISRSSDISDIQLLQNIVRILMAEVGSTTSVKKIADTLAYTGKITSQTTIGKYVRALCDNYLFYKVDRYDIKAGRHLKTQGKYYAIDPGIRNVFHMGKSDDRERQVENIVFLELLRREGTVHIGKLNDWEIDFVVTMEGERHYYQVLSDRTPKNVRERKIAALKKIADDEGAKTVLFLGVDREDAIGDGIRQRNLIEWISNESPHP